MVQSELTNYDGSMGTVATRIIVEFFGLARARTGTPRCELVCPGPDVTLADVWQEVTRQFPSLANTMAESDAPANVGSVTDMLGTRGYLINIDGKSFSADPQQWVRAGQTIIIMSADAGG